MTCADDLLVGMRGRLDVPRDGSELRGDVLSVGGWCLIDDSAVSHVDVLLDGIVVGRARGFVERADVADAFLHRDASVAGFEMLVPVDERPPGTTLEVSAIATSLDGRRWYSNSSRVVRSANVSTTPDFTPRSLVDDRRNAILKPSDTTASTRNVVVVTHDLNYGGGQLWLSELLRQFQLLDQFKFDIVSFVDGPLRDSLEEAGIFVHVTPSAAIDGAGAHDGRVTEFAVLFRALAADAVMVNTILPFQAVEAAYLLGLPVLWAIHESFPLSVYCHILWGGTVHPYVKSQFAAAFGLANGLMFEATQTADLFADFSLPANRHVIDYGVDVDEIDEYRRQFNRRDTRAHHGWTDNDFVIGVVGVFEGRKAQAAIVAAVDELSVVHPNVQLALVGAHASGYYDAVAEQVRRLERKTRVTLVPVTPDIYQWYAVADVLVCASDIESLPRSILEAMAFELPVISTDVFGVASLIDDGVTGWLTACHDLQGLIATIDRVVRLTPAERRVVATAARRDVERRSGERPYGNVIAEALSELMNDPHADVQQILRDRGELRTM